MFIFVSLLYCIYTYMYNCRFMIGIFFQRSIKSIKKTIHVQVCTIAKKNTNYKHTFKGSVNREERKGVAAI